MSSRYAVAPTPPAGPGEHPEDRAVDHYLSELARWRMRREHELSALDEVTRTHPDRDTLNEDVTASMTLYHAIAQRHDLLMATWEDVRDGDGEREWVSTLLWGVLEMPDGDPQALALALPDALRMSDAWPPRCGPAPVPTARSCRCVSGWRRCGPTWNGWRTRWPATTAPSASSRPVAGSTRWGGAPTRRRWSRSASWSPSWPGWSGRCSWPPPRRPTAPPTSTRRGPSASTSSPRARPSGPWRPGCWRASRPRRPWASPT
ncbi:hypothetical protein [Ornithinimicrobium sp. CNJ-824]|uniref:hypothetical protein n=1 Tax=Ornithinimicrobium sp. CNJ-824 TaxID=1904966 RepID=UPI00117C2176|nr:hypothetical protein [Ornithinimicrobium sp. CNJ-824]